MSRVRLAAAHRRIDTVRARDRILGESYMVSFRNPSSGDICGQLSRSGGIRGRRYRLAMGRLFVKERVSPPQVADLSSALPPPNKQKIPVLSSIDSSPFAMPTGPVIPRLGARSQQ